MLRKFLRGGPRSSPPKITGQPQSVYDAVPGSSVCLLVLTDRKQSLSEQMQFQWHHCPFACTKTSTSTGQNSWSPMESGGKDRITGINSSTLLLSEVRQSDRGSYRCQITNSSGTTLSRPATVTIVSPPQIEAHPRDVVDVVTGTSALFSVSVVSAAGEEVRRGGEGGEGGGGRERVGSGTWEDLQIMWEVLKTNSQSPAAMNEDIVNSGGNGSESPGPETPHQRIFRQHHPDLRQYLNTSSILPYLSRHSLVTSDQLEELTLPVLTNTRKVDLLLNWLPRSTVDFLEKFVVCLNEANDHLAHAELAWKLQTAMAESMRRGSQVSEANPPVSPVATLSPAPSPSDGGGETVGGGGRWKVVREEEGRVEGVTTPHLQLLHVDKEQEGRYRCRVEYKGCIIFSQSASLSILEDEEIVRRLLGQCRETEEGVADAAVDRFLEEHGNSSRLAKKALVSVLDSTSDPTSLLQSFTNRQVPVNFLHNGMYPLHYACVKGHWRAVQHLITCGASKTALTQQDGRNALHLVSMRGDNNSLQFLIHTGADQLINVQDKYGKTPLHLACEAAGKIAPGKHISQDMRDIKTVIQNLLKNKSSLRTQDKYPIPFLQNGQTPLHLAAMAGHPWVMEVFLLCDIGGVDDQDHDGNTCLHIASEMNWGEVVISLLERGANETLENKEHMTPLAVAEVKGHVEVADILQRKPGTVQRNRKQTLYFTVNKANGRPLSAHFGDVDMSTSPVTKSHKRLKKKSSSTDQQVRRSWSNLSANPAPDTAMKSPSSRSPSALLKMFHLTSPISPVPSHTMDTN